MTSTIKVNTVTTESESTLTLGESGKTIAIASGASTTGMGRAGAVDWQTTIKTGDFTAANGEGYFIDTSSGTITMTLPSSPSAGNIVALKDYANTFDTNRLTIGRNGSNIGGEAKDAAIVVEGQALTLVYADSTKGWLAVEAATDADLPKPAFIAATGGTVTTVCTNFKVHTFTGPGTFCVSAVGNAAGSNTVDYLVVAGGGGGGRWYGGGGGAGGYRFSSGTASGSYTTAPGPLSPLGASALPVTATGYPVTVGGGGTGGSFTPDVRAANGSNSVFTGSSTITSAGGGGGGGNSPGSFPTFYPGADGGSGGGGKSNTTLTGSAGAGNTPSVSPPQGFPAGTSSNPDQNAGGGGAGGASNPATTDGTSGGFGGPGIASSITGSPVGRGGGGSGNSATGSYGNANPTGSPFGGGVSNSPTTAGSSGTANTGGGGGAGPLCGSQTNAGTGGSGIVIIRYKFQ